MKKFLMTLLETITHRKQIKDLQSTVKSYKAQLDVFRLAALIEEEKEYYSKSE